MVQWLLEIEEGPRGLPCAGMPKGADPNVGGVKVLEEVCGLLCVDGSEGGGL